MHLKRLIEDGELLLVIHLIPFSLNQLPVDERSQS